MASEHELIIARCTAVGSAADPDYRQVLSCGRHQMLADERRAQGGADAGPMPFEYLLSALAACTSITLRMYAKRKGWEIGTVSVSASLRRGRDGDKVERRVALSAPLSAEQHSRLLEICEKTPVTLAVRAGVPIHTTLSPAQPGPALQA
jgi:putative redox protein